jgi:hypothetical protein
MALPKPQLPTYTTTIPSTKRKIKFRGFTVREEKILLIAQESEDVEEIMAAARNIITACVLDPIDYDSLATFDVEYLMTHIRAKSVGEVVHLTMPCDADPSHKRTPIVIDISKIEVKYPEGHETTIALYDDVGVKMKYPTINSLYAVDGAAGTDIIASCIDSIFTGDEVFAAGDQTPEEIQDFLESLTKQQLQLIEHKFFKLMPRYEYEFRYKCVECGRDHYKVIKGLSNFFG